MWARPGTLLVGVKSYGHIYLGTKWASCVPRSRRRSHRWVDTDSLLASLLLLLLDKVSVSARGPEASAAPRLPRAWTLGARAGPWAHSSRPCALQPGLGLS